jgi:hypothetical protein
VYNSRNGSPSLHSIDRYPFKSNQGAKEMDLDALLEASLWHSDGPLKKRLAHRGNQTISEFLLEHVKIGIRELDPELDPESPEFRTAVILMAAAYLVGPDVDLLVQFTGYPMSVVSDIAHRMRANGLWSDVQARTEGWFEGDKVTGVFWLDCLVADGEVYVERAANGEELYCLFDPEPKHLN